MTEKVLIRRLPTGVPGLDEVLGGGLPEFSFNLIAGAPGAGKTTLVHQIMFALARPDRRLVMSARRSILRSCGRADHQRRGVDRRTARLPAPPPHRRTPRGGTGGDRGGDPDALQRAGPDPGRHPGDAPAPLVPPQEPVTRSVWPGRAAGHRCSAQTGPVTVLRAARRTTTSGAPSTTAMAPSSSDLRQPARPTPVPLPASEAEPGEEHDDGQPGRPPGFRATAIGQVAGRKPACRARPRPTTASPARRSRC